MKFKDGIKYDIRGEEKAIRDYGERIRQSKGTGVTRTLTHIQGEEKEHKRELTQALQGLKSAK